MAQTDPVRYGSLVRQLGNLFNLNQALYPATLNDALEMVMNDDRGHAPRQLPQGVPGLAFGTVGGRSIPATDAQPNDKPNVMCHSWDRSKTDCACLSRTVENRPPKHVELR